MAEILVYNEEHVAATRAGMEWVRRASAWAVIIARSVAAAAHAGSIL